MNQEIRCKYCNEIILKPRKQGNKIQQYCSYSCSAKGQGKYKAEKIKQFMIEKYGVENPSQLEEIKQKKKETMIQNYGSIENAMSQMQQSLQNTMLERYGVENSSYINGIHEKRKQSTLKNHGVENYRNIEKSYQTKKKNKSFNTSKHEEKIFELLKEKFDIVERQYNKDQRYYYMCDFYIPELDLFIEYNKYWTHGQEPFDENSQEHQKILNEWKNKNTQHYKNAIYIWTENDPMKRQIAQKNNLNYLEFFDIKEFEKWLKEI